MILKLSLLGCCVAALVAAAAAGILDRVDSHKNEEETKFEEWFAVYNPEAARQINKKVLAEWLQNTDGSPPNEAALIEASKELAEWSQGQTKDLKEKFATNQSTFLKPENRRLYNKLSKLGDAALEEAEFTALTEARTRMEGIYATATICRDASVKDMSQCQPNDVLQLAPDLDEIITKSRNYNELLHVWKSWRDVSGKKMRGDYINYIALKNKAAVADGYNNTAEAWRAPYVEKPETENVEDPYAYTNKEFTDAIDRLWDEMKPLYQELHAYVRNKLVQKYGEKYVSPNGPIPAHLLGNMWAQTWRDLLDMTQPYPGKPSLDVSAEMVEQNWDAKKMFEMSEKFFVDLGLIEMPQEFHDNSIITKPDGKVFQCHASAWDFYNGDDFRVKQCTEVNMNDLFTVHHEMGHIEYFLQYKDQFVPFRDGANDGFHEAIGDTLTLSVATPKHLHGLGLLPGYSEEEDPEFDINSLFATAMEKIAFLPFGLAMDKYRYRIFEGNITGDDLNQEWWNTLLAYQGICSPSARTEDDFDPGAKFHIPADVPYMRYFVSFVIQFQFHDALCQKAGHTGSLDKCDINNSKDAGAALAEALKLGSSKSWRFAMEKITGQKDMSAEPFLRYFKPLHDFLTAQNQKDGVTPGWDGGPTCASASLTTDERFSDYVEQYNIQAETETAKSVQASWNFQTNLTDANQQADIAASAILAAFQKRIALEIKGSFDLAELTVEKNRRLYDKLTKLGDAALDVAEFNELKQIKSKMATIYSQALICDDPEIPIEDCPADKKLALDKHLTPILANSRDRTKLEYIWKAWRDATGKKMKDDYATYVDLKNKASGIDGYNNTGAAWRSLYVEQAFEYDDLNFRDDIRRIWEELRPLYEDLHAFVRFQLKRIYPDANIAEDGAIPAHLLGNMWAQSWSNLLADTIPFPDQPSVDVTEEMVAQNYDAVKMFQVSDDFFAAMGMIRMPESFWNDSMLVNPEPDRVANCHASAWDFYNKKDFRIKQCTQVTMDQLFTVHHEMGHVEYYLQYKDHPVPFRRGANDGFHEAIGDTLALSVATPAHLTKIGLLTGQIGDEEKMDLNYLYATALDKIAFLPFGLMMDMYRYEIFGNSTVKDDYNKRWWEYSLGYQGVCSPVARSEEDFDAGAKYHIPADVPYMRYFVSFIIQFQFHKAMCTRSGHTGPLHKCDISAGTPGDVLAAGALLGNAMKLGSSEPWQRAMTQLTGQTSMDAAPLLDFFAPLHDWIKEQNTANNVVPGWNRDPASATCLQPAAPPTDPPTNPTIPTDAPTDPTQPTNAPTDPTQPTNAPTDPTQPTNAPTDPTQPTNAPTDPTQPTNAPTDPTQPTNAPTDPTQPTNAPTDPTQPTNAPTNPTQPTNTPTNPTPPTVAPTQPSTTSAAERLHVTTWLTVAGGLVITMRNAYTLFSS